MAAVLCNACGDICSGVCEVCGHACRAPCLICSKACNGCCDVMGDACAGMAHLCSSPFSIFVTVAIIFNVPPAYVGLMELLAGNGLECRGSQWLFVNALLCLVNIAAAVYMAIVVVKANNNTTEEQGRTPTTSFGRAGHLLCYDPIMALYILVLLGFFCWLWTGGIWSLNGTVMNGCDDSVQGKIATGLGFGWAYIFCGFGALAIGMCCAYCGVGETGNNASSVPNYGTTSTSSPALSTPFVNAEAIPDKTSASTKNPPTVAAAATPLTASTNKQDIPTVKATLF